MRKVAGAPQGNRAWRDASGGSSRPGHNRRNRPVRYHTIRGPSVRVDVRLINLGDDAEIEHSVAAFAQSPNGGLILTASGLAVVHRDLIIRLAARHKLPAIYYEPHFVAAGGLVSYGPNFLDEIQPAVSYIDRILRGEKPADLPVQAQTKYGLTLNLKTAKALGLVIPPAILSRADEVIE